MMKATSLDNIEDVLMDLDIHYPLSRSQCLFTRSSNDILHGNTSFPPPPPKIDVANFFYDNIEDVLMDLEINIQGVNVF